MALHHVQLHGINGGGHYMMVEDHVSATDPDCGVNAMVNYTFPKGIVSLLDFTLQQVSGDLCIARPLDHETRSSYEIPVLATDRGEFLLFYAGQTNLFSWPEHDCRGEGASAGRERQSARLLPPRVQRESARGEIVSSAVVVIVATDEDSGRFGEVTYEIIAGNDLGLFQIDHRTGEIFVLRSLSTDHPLHHLVISVKDGGGLTATAKAHVYISVISSDQQPPVFQKARYTFFVQGMLHHRAGPVRYVIYSGDPEGFFTIDPLSGTIKTKGRLDHETHPFLLLNIQATVEDRPYMGILSNSLKISVPENADLRTPIYVVHAEDLDSNRNGEVQYILLDNPDNMFVVGEKSGSIMLQHLLDYELRRHYILILSAVDSGSPQLSSNVTLMVEVQDVNDNAPAFEKSEYKVNVLESLSVNSQFLQVTATDMDTGNNARLTYKMIANAEDPVSSKFGIFPNSGFLYLKETLDREAVDTYSLTVSASDNGSPSLSSTAVVLVQVLDANDNDPEFVEEAFVFSVQENLEQGQHVGTVSAIDRDLGNNASLRYSLLNSNGSFQINPVTGEIFTQTTLDRESRPRYELTAEVRDQGTPHRSDRALVNVEVIDRNDNPLCSWNRLSLWWRFSKNSLSAPRWCRWLQKMLTRTKMGPSSMKSCKVRKTPMEQMLLALTPAQA
ncbi:protein dachsous [Caerostris extrusa]|uniref:Protein dachsous n=1 Tax=Caerostris extrusa TaxID=172846 RepID=A0AAV4WI53_CAEEX|nr:protein dachsous [Caerostris extrusa]